MSQPIVYRDIPSYPDYRAGSDGSVWTSKRSHLGPLGDWKRLTPFVNMDGYYQVTVTNYEGKRRAYCVHLLILIAFDGHCPPGLQACHNDGNKLNNTKENLRWDTASSNGADKVRHGTTAKGSKHGKAKLNESLVSEIKTMLVSGVTHRKIARAIGVGDSTIYRIKTGETWSHVAPLETS